ncbi:baculoviral IAP repeat-containing protein 2-like [Gigantopelta aegis]|uniref:baculoviral IAP repeat-containing protein 2-like n=1 Tax=Gigantopelta aegis TaxID=1735272 RepID=UPI001B88A51A|nr:baculoviral IAP repeat-containing protein 2-like [Gigantopelta aegis]
MSSHEYPRFLSEDDVAKIPRAIVGDIRPLISPIISKADWKMSINDILLAVNCPDNFQDVPENMKYLTNRTQSLANLTNIPNDAAKAGFFYTGHGDTLRCFSCGRDVRDWSNTDDAWLRHAELSPKCVHNQRWTTIHWKNGSPMHACPRRRLLSSPCS